MSGSTYDPACDQCRLKKIRCGREQPRCVNCERSGVPCGFSERGKRSNQSRLVIDYLEGVKARLDTIEETMTQFVTAAVELSHTKSAKASEAPSPAESRSQSGDDSDHPDTPPRKRHRVCARKELGGTSSSLRSLVDEVSEFLRGFPNTTQNRALNDTEPSTVGVMLQECLVKIKNMFEAMETEGWVNRANDGRPLALPPRSLLDALAEPYFTHINPILPMFQKQEFLKKLAKNYKPGIDVDEGQVLCFNNIVLQALNMNVKQGPTMAANDAMETELIKLFHANYRRGLSKLERLSNPSLVNVQALMSMFFVAQQGFECKLASLLLNQACFVAKSIGLHRRDSLSSDSDPELALERQNVFWTLYILDKTSSLGSGTPCSLPTFDCDVPLPQSDPTNPAAKNLIARIELATIQEDVFKSLYSSRARRQSDRERNSQRSQLNRRLTEWASHNKNACTDDVQDLSSVTHANLALSFSFHSTLTLVHRSSEHESSRQQCRRSARACMRLFIQLDQDSNSVEAAVMMRQVILSHPLTPLFVLFLIVTNDPSSDESVQDVQLMNRATEVLRQLEKECSNSCDHMQRLFDVAASCCRFVTFLTRPVSSSATLSNAPDAGGSDNGILPSPPAGNDTAHHSEELTISGAPWSARPGELVPWTFDMPNATSEGSTDPLLTTCSGASGSISYATDVGELAFSQDMLGSWPDDWTETWSDKVVPRNQMRLVE